MMMMLMAMMVIWLFWLGDYNNDDDENKDNDDGWCLNISTFKLLSAIVILHDFASLSLLSSLLTNIY